MLDLFLSSIFNGFLFFALHLDSTSSFPPPLTANKELDCLHRMQKGDEEARETLIVHNMRLVAHIVKKYYSSCIDQDDLISVGTIGLIKGINTFKPDKGTRLATYVAKCIENAILS